jgi:hypothetical protein
MKNNFRNLHRISFESLINIKQVKSFEAKLYLTYQFYIFIKKALYYFLLFHL